MKTIGIQCPSCKGTGLYMGACERDGAAVVCHTCNGSGHTTFSYEEFTGKMVRVGVKRVYAGSFGYIHSASNVIDRDSGREIKFAEGGCSYEEWLNGAKPMPVKDLYCPYQWDNRGIGNEPCSRCAEGMAAYMRIDECRFRCDMKACWDEYEQKNK